MKIALYCSLSLNILGLNAAIINVGPPPASIQTAINAAVNGDIIQLSAGTYVQEVQVINKSIDIIGVGVDVTIIQSPNATTHLTQSFVFGSNIWCVVMVDNQAAPIPQTVNISDLTIDGSNQQDTVIPPIYSNSDRFFALGYHNANGTVSNVHTTNTRQTANFNELAGGGIINASSAVAVTFNVTNSLVDFYQRLGIDCRGSTLTANISNTIVDRGYVLPLNTITATPNGIQFSGSVMGQVNDCTVSTNISTVAGVQATGIIIVGGGANIQVSGSTASNNDIGIIGFNAGANLLIDNNTVNYTTALGVNEIEGIVVQDTAGTTTISNNIYSNMPNVSLELISTTDLPFQLANNQFFGSEIGMRITGAGNVGPIVSMNGDAFVGQSIYYIQEVDAPNDVWPTTATVSFDGLTSGSMTFAQFNQVLTKIFDQHNDPALGLVLDFIPPPIPLPPRGPLGTACRNSFATQSVKLIVITWDPSPSANVILYRLYLNGALISEVASDSLLKFVGRFCPGIYQITSVNSFGNESDPILVSVTK